MWYIVIFLGYFSSDIPNINIITNKTFETLEVCIVQEINIRSNYMVYDEVCIHESEIENIPFDKLIEGMEPNQEIILKMPPLSK
jgi:hypothetical protein